MKDFLVINQQGKLIDNSKQYNFSGGQTVNWGGAGGSGGNWGGITASYIAPSIAPSIAQNQAIAQLPANASIQMIAPNSLAWVGAPSSWTVQQVQPPGVSFGMSAQTVITNVARTISGNPADYGVPDANLKSVPGGVFYKDQEGPKYSPVIVGKFSNKM